MTYFLKILVAEYHHIFPIRGNISNPIASHTHKTLSHFLRYSKEEWEKLFCCYTGSWSHFKLLVTWYLWLDKQWKKHSIRIKQINATFPMLRLTDVELVWNYGLCNFHQYETIETTTSQRRHAFVTTCTVYCCACNSLFRGLLISDNFQYLNFKEPSNHFYCIEKLLKKVLKLILLVTLEPNEDGK